MTQSIFEKYAAVRAQYPEDIEHIEAEEQRVKKLLQTQEFASHPITREFLDMCRKDVVECRRKLATDRDLINHPDVQADLWAIIDARMWFIGLVSRDFEGEIAMIEAGLDAELQR
jgi:hypothetical protein